MNKRPLSVTIIGWTYLVMGVAGFAYHLTGLRVQHRFQSDILWVELIFLVAIVSGAFMFRGRNWARWLAIACMGFHVVLSFFHTVSELAIHSLLCAVPAYFLFRAAASRYFPPSRMQSTPRFIAGAASGDLFSVSAELRQTAKPFAIYPASI
jgi:hypothetical protein